MIDNMWFDTLQKPFCKIHFHENYLVLVNECTKKTIKNCNLCIFIKSKFNLILNFKCTHKIHLFT